MTAEYSDKLFASTAVSHKFCTMIQIGRGTDMQRTSAGRLSQCMLNLSLLSEEHVAHIYALMCPNEVAYTDAAERLPIHIGAAALFQENDFVKYSFVPVVQNNELVFLCVFPFVGETVDFILSVWSAGFKLGAVSNEKLQQLLKMHFSKLRAGEAFNNLTDTEISTMLESILQRVKYNKASDLHFVPSDSKVTVEMRVDGDIVLVDEFDLVIGSRIIHKIKEITCLDDTNDKVPRTGMATVPVGEDILKLRISLIPGLFGVDVNARIVTDDARCIEDLGFTDLQKKEFGKLLTLSKGLVLVVGPTGSGKTTSLYGGIATIIGRKVMTVEDPVEYVTPGILQVNINEEQKTDFMKVIAAFMRHDPDVIVVGEIRNLEVATSAIVASNTGHLVLSTLHTNSAVTAANRLVTLGVDRYLVAEELSGVMSQRLIKRVCSECSKKMLVPDAICTELGLPKGQLLPVAQGCPGCSEKGYKGRLAVVEMLKLNKQLRSAIESQASTARIEEIAREFGFKSMVEDALEKAKLGLTTLEQVRSLKFNLD